MELLMSDYIIKNIIDVKDELPNSSSVLLWVWHADKIPPHIGLSLENQYFSLKANGKDFQLPVDNVFDLLAKKKITTLCFVLNNDIDLNSVLTEFKSYDQTIPFKVTCLNPIKNLLKCSEANKLIDLLEELERNNEVGSVFGFNVSDAFSGIKNYSTDDIHSRLTKLYND